MMLRGAVNALWSAKAAAATDSEIILLFVGIFVIGMLLVFPVYIAITRIFKITCFKRMQEVQPVGSNLFDAEVNKSFHRQRRISSISIDLGDSPVNDNIRLSRPQIEQHINKYLSVSGELRREKRRASQQGVKFSLLDTP